MLLLPALFDIMVSLRDELIQLYKSDQYPFHMPGHKRRGDLAFPPEAVDVTEVIGTDNLYEPTGILREALDYAGKIYGCPDTYYLLNGSTVGNITAIHAAAERGDRILVASNGHRSVLNASKLRGLKVDRLQVERDEEIAVDTYADPDKIARILTEAEPTDPYKALVITSPTYEGVVSDVKRIAEICHAHNVILVVDEAHGAHLSMDERLPKGAIDCGADIVVHSVHKMLAGLTQTGLLHVQGDLVSREKISEYLAVFQTSSPSYLLMSSIDGALREIEREGAAIWTEYLRIRDIYGSYERQCELLGEPASFRVLDTDPCKIVMSTAKSGLTGQELQMYLLIRYNIQTELAGDRHVVALCSYRDVEEGMVRLGKALLETDQALREGRLDMIRETAHRELDKLPPHINESLFAPCITRAE